MDPKNTPLDPAAAGRLLRAVAIDIAESPADRADPASTTPEPRPPSLIPGYTIDRLLGEGGGGTVYRAFRQGSDRPLALKILKTRAGDRAARRAWRELEILEHLRLPCLPRLIDYGEHNGRLFFATEFIEGQHLDKYCEGGTALQSGVPAAPDTPDQAVPPRRHPLPLRPRVELLAKVADAVQALHEHGIIHRDIKPSNIIVADDGQPMLVDLGLAALVDAGQTQWTLTEDGAPIGTPAFMAPEQARGERSRVSTRTDVYGLGATAYLILTGHTPHDTHASLHEAIRRVAHDQPREPRALRPDLPRPLAAVLRKACEREPPHRYASAAEFGADLRRWLRGQPVEAGGRGAWARATRWVTRHPVATTGMLCLLVALCFVAGTFVAIRFLWNAPAGIKVNDAAHEVQLLSYAGRVIRGWPYAGVEHSGPPFATLLPRADAFGGGQVILTKIRTQDLNDPFHYQLCLWDLSDLSSPQWATARRDRTLVSPPPWHEPEDSYNIATELVADVFTDADSPGLEIVVVHQHNAYHPACIRVYDFAGHVLFEVWHKGSTGPAYWIPKPGMLVLRACCGYTTYSQLGVSDVPQQQTWPEVVFAIRPQRGQRLDWVRPSPEWPGTEPAWYYMIQPLERARLFTFSAFRMPDDAERRADCVDVSVELVGEDAALGLRIDSEGKVVGTPVKAGRIADVFPGSTDHAIWLGPVPASVR